MSITIIILSCVSICFSVTALILNITASKDNRKNIQNLFELYRQLKENDEFLQKDVNHIWNITTGLPEDEEDDSSI